MPIRPENLARYPKTWKAMVAQARERSGDRCECVGQCGLAHGGGRCDAMNGLPHPMTGATVVLTLAHEHGVPLEETVIDRMFHACQRCHNRYDAPMRAAGKRARARQRLMTDEAGHYPRLGLEYADHQVVHHGAEEYVRGEAHTNTGTVSVSRGL